MSIVGLVNFLAHDVEARLDKYAQCTNVVAVREHLGWDQDNSRRRFAERPDLLTDSLWLRGLSRLARYKLKCSLEVFSPERTMFGSHHPICGLSRSFPAPYAAYKKMSADLSSAEQDAVFRLNAAEWFFGREGL